MSHKRGYLVLAALNLSILTTLLPSPSAGANASPSTGAIRVSPALSKLRLSQGESSATIVATVTNLTNAPLTISLDVRDFGAQQSQPGAISFYGSNYNPNTNPHSLQAAMSLSDPQILLAPKASQKVRIALTKLSQLAAGGHYGAVLFSPEPAADLHSNAKVSINSAIASLIFLQTASGGTQTVQLLPFSPGTIHFALPSTSYIAFKDTGNTQVAPIGQLTLYDPTGNIVSTTVINPASGLILPGTSRLFDVPLTLRHPWLLMPGKYRFTLEYRSDSQAGFTTVNRTLYYVNLFLIVPIIIAIVALIWLVKHRGKALLKTLRNIRLLVRRFKRKQPAPVPVKPKRRPPLIQG